MAGMAALATSASAAPDPVVGSYPSAQSALPGLTAQTFADPPREARPAYRWFWLRPAVDHAEIDRSIGAMAEAGAGHVEIGWTRAGATPAEAWGGDAWADSFKHALQASKDNGVKLDFYVGPMWPSVVPAVTSLDDPAAGKQLAYGRAFVRSGEAAPTSLPAPVQAIPRQNGVEAQKRLVTVLAVRCAQAGCATQTEGMKLLDRSTVRDISDRVDGSGALSWTAPADGGTWVVMPFWQTAEGWRVRPAAAQWYSVDHFSRAGAEAVTDFWDGVFSRDGVAPLLRDAGGDFFEDSLELGETITHWSPGLPAEFRKLRGYDVLAALPVIAGLRGKAQESAEFDYAGGQGERMRRDFRKTLSDMYTKNRLDTLRSWAHDWGLRFRAQPYGLPLDNVTVNAHVDVPEYESLAWSAEPVSQQESYKLAAMGATLNGNSLVSCECGAIFNGAFRSTLGGAPLSDAAGSPSKNQSLLSIVYRAFAGGVTRPVWHTYGETDNLSTSIFGDPTIPPTPGPFAVAEALSPLSPNWSDQIEANTLLGRLGYVLRQGQPRFDVGVYQGTLGNDNAGPGAALTSDEPIAKAGYTYTYLNTDALRRNGAEVRDGVLFPDRYRFRAFIVDAAEISIAAAEKVREMAQSGLPVVVVGDAPDTTPGVETDGDEDARVRSLMQEALAQPTVANVGGEDEVPAALRRLGVEPAARPASTPLPLSTVRRTTQTTNYYFVENPADAAVDASLALTGEGVPYRLDAATGTITPVAGYVRSGDRVTIPVHLEGNDATVYALSTTPLDGAAQPLAAIAATDRGEAVLIDGKPAVRAGADGQVGATLTTGERVVADVRGAVPPQPLRGWTLSAEVWRYRGAKTAQAPIALTAAADGTLPAWTEIPSLGSVSGIGTYTTTVTLPADWTAGRQGAYLSLGRATDGVRLWVNGRRVGPLNPNDLNRIDVGAALQPGANAIRVAVSSTLFNGIWPTAPGQQRYGLFGPVTLTPYAQALAQRPAVDQPRPPVDQPRPPVEQPRRPSAKVTVKAAGSIRLAGLAKQGLLVKVTVPQKAKLALTLSAKLPRAKRASTLARASRSTTKAATVSLRLKAGRAAVRKLKLALKRKQQVTAAVAVTTTLADGTPATKTLRIAIRR